VRVLAPACDLGGSAVIDGDVFVNEH